MSGLPVEGMMTADDLARLPDDGWIYELARGRLVRMAPASWIPGVVASRVGGRIELFAGEQHLGYCSTADTGFLLSTNPDVVRAPDVGFVRGDRVVAGNLPRRYFPGSPDLAVELRSPTDSIAETLRKIADYLDAGTALVWFLEPEHQRATVYRADGGVTIVGENGELDGEAVLPGFTLRLSDVWL